MGGLEGLHVVICCNNMLPIGGVGWSKLNPVGMEILSITVFKFLINILFLGFKAFLVIEYVLAPIVGNWLL